MFHWWQKLLTMDGLASFVGESFWSQTCFQIISNKKQNVQEERACPEIQSAYGEFRCKESSGHWLPLQWRKEGQEDTKQCIYSVCSNVLSGRKIQQQLPREKPQQDVSCASLSHSTAGKCNVQVCMWPKGKKNHRHTTVRFCIILNIVLDYELCRQYHVRLWKGWIYLL